ncbi:MAG TPA: universal stress protein [Anaerolineae bacterium]|nr:universal stress protein [Anaerolineae bacterium]
MYKKILTVLNLKESDENVIAHVQKLALQMKADITLVRVITVADDGGEGLGRQFQLEEGSRGWRKRLEAERCLPQYELRLRQAGLNADAELIIGGQSEGEEIVIYATENNCDLIVMANDPRPWYTRWVGGSPSSEVQRKSNVPTLFINDGTKKVWEEQAAPKENKMMAIFGSGDL